MQQTTSADKSLDLFFRRYRLFYIKLSDSKYITSLANSVDPNQTAHTSGLIRGHTVCPYAELSHGRVH